MSKSKPSPEAPTELQTIDPTALTTVSGGSGMDPMMLMMMMMMGGRNSAPAVVAQPAGTIGGYAGYTVDGVFYPFK